MNSGQSSLCIPESGFQLKPCWHGDTLISPRLRREKENQSIRAFRVTGRKKRWGGRGITPHFVSLLCLSFDGFGGIGNCRRHQKPSLMGQAMSRSVCRVCLQGGWALPSTWRRKWWSGSLTAAPSTCGAPASSCSSCSGATRRSPAPERGCMTSSSKAVTRLVQYQDVNSYTGHCSLMRPSPVCSLHSPLLINTNK